MNLFILPRSVRLRSSVLLTVILSTHLLARDVPAERKALFVYDVYLDLQVQQRGEEKRGDAIVKDVSFDSSAHSETPRRVNAFIVLPSTAAPHAGILWCHWLGQPATSNRSQFLDEAVALARQGAVSVLVDAMWSDPKWYETRNLDDDFRRGVEQVIAFRRGLDLLLAQPGVDPKRVGFVGHDYSAMYGSVAVAVDDRVHAAVFMAAAPRFADWAFFVKKPSSMETYLAQNAPLEIAEYVKGLTDIPVLLQFAGHDRYVPVTKAHEFAALVPDPKTFRLYDTAEHDMTRPPEIRTDRDAWIISKLQLSDTSK